MAGLGRGVRGRVSKWGAIPRPIESWCFLKHISGDVFEGSPEKINVWRERVAEARKRQAAYGARVAACKAAAELAERKTGFKAVFSEDGDEAFIPLPGVSDRIEALGKLIFRGGGHLRRGHGRLRRPCPPPRGPGI